MKRRYGHDQTIRRAPAPGDAAQRVIMDRIATAAIEAMRPMVEDEPCRLVKSFTRADIDKLTVAVVVEYIAAREDAELADELNDDISDIGM